jgi:hypothetical protein
VVEVVRGDARYNTFQLAARRIKDTVVTLKPARQSRKIAAVQLKNPKGEEIFPGVEPDMSVEDKFYQLHEWRAMSKAKKKGVLIKRQNRGPAKKKDKPPKRKFSGRQKKQIMSLVERQIASMSIGDRAEQDVASDDSNSSSEEEDSRPKKKPKKKKTTNRNHPDLQRRRR